MPHSCHQHEHFTLNNMSDSLLKIQSKTVKIYFFKHSKWIKKIYNSAITTVTKNFVPTLKLLTIPDQFITTMKAGCISQAWKPDHCNMVSSSMVKNGDHGTLWNTAAAWNTQSYISLGFPAFSQYVDRYTNIYYIKLYIILTVTSHHLQN